MKLSYCGAKARFVNLKIFLQKNASDESRDEFKRCAEIFASRLGM